MLLEKDLGEKLGEKVGYLFGYLSFTTVLFFVLGVFGRLPAHWGYLHVMFITCMIVLAGTLLKRLLK